MRRTQSAIVIAIITVSLAACSSATPAATAVPATTGTGTPTGSVSVPTTKPTPTTALVTPEPTIEAPEPTMEATQGKETLLVTKQSYGSGIWVSVIVPITNTGSTWINVAAGQSDFTIYDANDDVLETGSFLYAYPAFLAPGETGYIADETTIDDVSTTAVLRVESNVYFDEASVDEARILTNAKAKNKIGKYDETATTTGTVTNTSSETVQSAHVGAFYFDGSGRILGYSMTNLVENLAAGQTKGYSTLTTYSKPFKLSAIKKTLVFASSSY